MTYCMTLAISRTAHIVRFYGTDLFSSTARRANYSMKTYKSISKVETE